MAERVQVREIDDDEGRRLLRMIRRGTGSVVTWRRAQMVLLSAQGMPVAKIAEVSFTSDDRVRDVIHNFNTDGFDSLYPKYKGGRPRTFTPGRLQSLVILDWFWSAESEEGQWPLKRVEGHLAEPGRDVGVAGS
ncbi:transposase, partial [Streptomyces sp. NPDC058572]|uniref:helix-turn-helix domain-containing protein n=1 Tax=Streptomyces sp. NPDC058572 TaxID=3346546 RepID=UPI003664482F